MNRCYLCKDAAATVDHLLLLWSGALWEFPYGAKGVFWVILGFMDEELNAWRGWSLV